MNRPAVLVSLILVASPAAAHASRAPAGKAQPSRAQAILVHMVSALHHVNRIQASGWAGGQGQPRTKYRLRYQATAREDYRASVARTKQSPATTPGDLHYILLGRTMYSRVASRWYRFRGTSTPDPVDTLSLSSNGVFCCSPTGLRAGTIVSFKGTARGPNGPVYVIAFKSGAAAGGSFGTIYVSTGSFLPAWYTITTRPVQTTGSFSLTYGGTFTIQAPHT
jgi:hypothetical protein